MLYITTRNDRDSYTAHKALHADFAQDGGLFVPFHLPVYSADEIALLKEKTFGETVTGVMNLFFSSRLAPWDLDFSVGRNITRIVPMNHRIVIAELWHNLEGNFSYVEKVLQNAIVADGTAVPGNWLQICVRMAALVGLYGELLKNETVMSGQYIDISVPNDGLKTLMAAWYCRRMGLPIHTIICCCEETGNLWDFIHRGVVSPLLLSSSLQLGVERLIHAALGCEEALRFSECCVDKKVYSVDEEKLPALNKGLFCTVAGGDRALNTINSVFRSNACIIDPDAALCYSGLQDYRAKTGESGLTLLLSERTPVDFAKDICNATGLSQEKLHSIVSRS